MSTTGYLLWGQIQYEDVNEQRKTCGAAKGYGSVKQPVKVLWGTYRYNICTRGSVRLQSDGEIGVPEMKPSHVQLNLQYVAVYSYLQKAETKPNRNITEGR